MINNNEKTVSFDGNPVSLEEILNSREERSLKQEELLKKNNNTLISFKLNIPGAIKNTKAYSFALDIGANALEEELSRENITIIYEEISYPEHGPYKMYIVKANKKLVKEITIKIEETHPLGRIYDIDVEDRDGAISRRELGRSGRRCILCEDNAFICGREKRHSLESLLGKIHKTIIDFINNTN